MFMSRHSRTNLTPEAAVPAVNGEFPLFREMYDEFVAVALGDTELVGVLAPGDAKGAVGRLEALAQAEVVQVVAEEAEWLAQDDEIIEIRVSMRDRVEYLRPVDPLGVIFLYVVFDKAKGRYLDLAAARVRMAELAFGLQRLLSKSTRDSKRSACNLIPRVICGHGVIAVSAIRPKLLRSGLGVR